jgi:hypothetical protein
MMRWFEALYPGLFMANMHRRSIRCLVIFAFAVSLWAWCQEPPKQKAPKQEAFPSGGDFSSPTGPPVKLPENLFIVNGPSASASDSATPVPEGGSVSDNVLSNPYFGITYALPQDWYQKLQPPPPSESGQYVLARLRPSPSFRGPTKGTIMITADDMFFTNLPARNALEVASFTKDHLQAGYKLEMKPTELSLGGRPFTFFAYWSPEASIHWYVLVTQIRCHAVQIVLSGLDTKLLEDLMRGLDKMKLSADAGPTAGAGGGAVPVCIKDYANGKNLVKRLNPAFATYRVNPVPVRIVINKEGIVKHVHFIRAFPEQAAAIAEALGQWRFKPYLQDGKPVEVETGIMFGSPSLPRGSSAKVPTAD